MSNGILPGGTLDGAGVQDRRNGFFGIVGWVFAVSFGGRGVGWVVAVVLVVVTMWALRGVRDTR